MKRALCVVLLVMACGDDDVVTDAGLAGLGDSMVDTLLFDAGNPDVSDSALDSGPDRPTVTVTGGDVVGIEEMGVQIFRNIPYAAPPVGTLRFARPEAHAGWDSPLDTAATPTQIRCPQRNNRSGVFSGQEDCLVVNIYAPEDAENAPVMVFIHGGGFSQGAPSDPLFEGSLLADRGVVLVSISYRLGTLGFLALAEQIEPDGGTGNFGMHDQILALQWVQDNIGAFGGDASNTTIFGESAGAASVNMHVASPLSAGLFARAISQSGGGGYGLTVQADATARGEELVEAMGCGDEEDVVSCLRAIEDIEAIAASASVGDPTGLGLPNIGPHVDGVVLEEQVFDAVEGGRANDVPWIIGHNADEATIFTAAIPVNDEAGFRTLLSAIYDASTTDAIVDLYPSADHGSWKGAFNAFFGEVGFVCSALELTRVASGGEPAYAYHFTRVLPGRAGLLGAFHGLELVYVFGHTDISPMYTPNDDDAALAEGMQRAWVSFATDGSLDFRPGWNAYAEGSGGIAIMDTPLSTRMTIKEGRCAELQGLGVLR